MLQGLFILADRTGIEPVSHGLTVRPHTVMRFGQIILYGGPKENRTPHRVLARHSRPLGTCRPIILPAYRIQGHHIVVSVYNSTPIPKGISIYTLVPTGGNDPPSLGYQPSALPLSYAGNVWRSQRVTIPLLMRDRHLCVHEHLETKIYHSSTHFNRFLAYQSYATKMC